jgi:tRNA-dihydrouridine synthase B
MVLQSMTPLFSSQGFTIGSVPLEGRVILAPLAGTTDYVFRKVCREHGASLCVTEMVSADGLARGNRKTLDMIDVREEDRPLAVQIFGSDPNVLADAARIVEQAGGDLVDLNIGCPVRKVVKRGAGAAILGDLDLLQRILHQVVSAVKIPVTIKIRSGIRTEQPVAVEVAKIAQGEGIQAIALHPRSLRQGFSGKADWSLIARVVEQCSLPIIGSGDIFSAVDAVRMVRETGCHAVMVARGVLGNSHLIRQIAAAFRGDPIPIDLSPEERLNALLEFYDLNIVEYGARRGVPRMRTPINWYVRGLPGAVAFRRSIVTLKDPDQVRQAICDFRDQVAGLSISDSAQDSG